MSKLVWNQKEADKAVDDFREDLKVNVEYAKTLASLWRKYYTKAGHKLLARELLKFGENYEQEQS